MTTFPCDKYLGTLASADTPRHSKRYVITSSIESCQWQERHKEKNEADNPSSIGDGTAGPDPAIPFIAQKGSRRSVSVPEEGRSVSRLVQPQLQGLEPGLVGSGADAFSDEDDPAWGPRVPIRISQKPKNRFPVFYEATPGTNASILSDGISRL
jgi:hypothetical protein